MSKILLIDADALVYNIAFSGETSINWAEAGEPDVWTTWADAAEGWYRVVRAVDTLKETHGADRAIMCLSDPTANFRLDLLPSYKGNRAETKKPLLHAPLRAKIAEEMETFLRPRLEADDVMGILATSGDRIIKGEKLIISDDKDMRTLPAPQAKFNAPAVLSPTLQEADHFWLYQTLIGDSTDNYAGCPGVGPVKAEKILDDPDKDNMPRTAAELWYRIVAAYEKAGLTEADALIQARCARILRFGDYDFQNKEPILWTP